MNIFLVTTGLFAFAFVVHVLVWKIRLPHYQIRALMLIFLLVFLSWLPFGNLTLPGLVQVGIFYISVSLCYIVTYSAIEGDSPTLSLMMFTARCDAAGVSEQTLKEFLEKKPFVRRRIEALVHDGLIVEKEGCYFLAGRPSLFFRLILDFRKLYGPVQRGG
jgi:hypothetical protein